MLSLITTKPLRPFRQISYTEGYGARRGKRPVRRSGADHLSELITLAQRALAHGPCAKV